MIDLSALWRATKDAFGLAYMKGGGAGCNYPDASFSQSRLWFHHLVFYGFLLDFAATTHRGVLRSLSRLAGALSAISAGRLSSAQSAASAC